LKASLSDIGEADTGQLDWSSVVPWCTNGWQLQPRHNGLPV